jgi:hypothetical protein
MAQESHIEVINKFGWRKEFVVDKPIIQIGRDARNDLVLDDGFENGIAPRHAQLLPSSINRQGLRLVNLSDKEIQVFAQGGKTLANPLTAGGGGNGHIAAPAATLTAAIAPRSSAEIASGDLPRGGVLL